MNEITAAYDLDIWYAVLIEFERQRHRSKFKNVVNVIGATSGEGFLFAY